MDQQVTFFIILGMAVVTYLPRLFPVWFLSSRDLPGVVIVWLKYIPAAVLAALLLPSVVVTDNRLDLGMDNLFLLAALPTLLVALKTRSLFASVLVGMLLVAAGRYFLGFS